jgi:hypothetical protein
VDIEQTAMLVIAELQQLIFAHHDRALERGAKAQGELLGPRCPAQESEGKHGDECVERATAHLP